MFQSSSAANYNALQDDFHCNFDARIPYRDPVFAVLFVVQLITAIVIAIVYGRNIHTEIDSHGPDPAIVDVYWSMIAIIGIGCLTAVLFGLAWIKFLRSHAESIIHLSVMTNIALQVIIGIFALLGNIPVLSLVMFISAALLGLWYFVVRNRTKFVSVLLELSVSAINHNPAVIWASLLGQIVAVFWVGIWSIATLAAISLNNKSEENSALGIYTFSLILSFFWTLEVLRNSIHTITAGVCGTYYFFGVTRSPTLKSAKRTFTTSFGSVCLGSLVVSLIETLRTLFRNQRERNNDNIANACVDCILGCIEALTAYISKFAFTRVAVYGESFMTAARNTYDMFKSKGVDVLIADELSGFALISGAILGGSVAAVSAVIASVLFVDDPAMPAVLGITCFIIGSGVVSIMMSVLTSGVATFLVLWAEEPHVLQTNHPRLYAKLSGAVRSQYPAFAQPIV